VGTTKMQTVSDRLKALEVAPMSEARVYQQGMHMEHFWYAAYMGSMVAAFILLAGAITAAVSGFLSLSLAIPLAAFGSFAFAAGLWGFRMTWDFLTWKIAPVAERRIPPGLKPLVDLLVGEFGPDSVQVRFAQVDPYLLVDDGNGGKHFVAHWFGPIILHNGAI
jgi:hypothetical protein